MKTIFISIITILLSINLYSQIAVGGGIGYNEKVSSVGITIKGEFNITNEIAVSPNISYFFGNSTFLGYNQNLLGIDVNATYTINIIDKLKVYPVVGINFSSYKTQTSFYFIENETIENDTAIGANIGAGAQWQFTNMLSVYLEPKYIASNYSQIVVNAGVLLKL
ncbi:outer membrane beta-barrel protein [Lacinutrix sp. 5H-3-7-4]|uniref:outer membrane beta-barrel protein n=1 Tax=Lacinutrix sp. (strain 5H-3-7-4) TaxID=983544 RepID=UPI00020A3D76|nr:outer membrane beta-barrel protein [Lacinutrix sp. 5H-3-7-4]AEH01509.1 hypothetical protein Lacal_1661 [Lacinutrix sp. 5H-3-7-4]